MKAAPRQFDAGAEGDGADRLLQPRIGRLLPRPERGEPGQPGGVRRSAQQLGLQAPQLVEDGGGAPPRRRVAPGPAAAAILLRRQQRE